MSGAKTETETKLSSKEIFDKAAASALRGGTAGAVAMGLNVGALMWMRTTVRLLLCIYIDCNLQLYYYIIYMCLMFTICNTHTTQHII